MQSEEGNPVSVHPLRPQPDAPADLSPRSLATHFALLYSNSMCRQSSMPTSILMLVLESGGMRYEWTHSSRSLMARPRETRR